MRPAPSVQMSPATMAGSEQGEVLAELSLEVNIDVSIDVAGVSLFSQVYSEVGPCDTQS